MRVFLIVLISSLLSLAFGWNALPKLNYQLRYNLFELYTAASTLLEPCPTDSVLKSKFQNNRKGLEKLRSLIAKHAWSKQSELTGHDIVCLKEPKLLSYDPWEIVESRDKNSLYLNQEEKKHFENIMEKCGIKSIIKDTDGVVKFEFWTKTIPHMRLRKFIVYNPSPYEVDNYSTKFQNFGSRTDEDSLTPLQRIYFPTHYYSYKKLVDGWGIEYGIM